MKLYNILIPIIRQHYSPVFHMRWLWGGLNIWRKDDRVWGIQKTRTHCIHIQAHRCEFWINKLPRRSRKVS